MAFEAPSHPQIEATIEQLRYWVPTITDVARVAEFDHAGVWTLSIAPRIASACPVELTLRDNGRFDIVIGGEIYADCSLGTLDQIVRLLERITEGQVIQRRWVSPATGAPFGTETIVLLGPDSIWHGGDAATNALAGSLDGAGERHDRHFLPYRRN